MKLNKDSFIQIGIIVFGALLFMTGLGRVHLFDWDEINFAESAREMLFTADFLKVQINFETFWEKPPLFIWMQTISMYFFGVNEFAARLPNAIAGILTLLVLFSIGKTLKNRMFGLLWALCYACSFLPFFYFKSGIIDPWFNLFIFLGIYQMILYTSPRTKYFQIDNAIFSAFFLGLATLTKGPVGFLIFGLCFLVWLAMHRFKIAGFRWRHLLAFVGMFILIGGFWFILQIISGNWYMIQDFISYQIRLFQTEDAGHGGFPGYHFIILFFGVFPASIFALPTFRKKILQQEDDPYTAHFFRWMMITLWVVLILFTVVRTKIVHYSSMCYFPITFLAAWYMEKWITGKTRPTKWMVILLTAIGSIVGIAVCAITFFDRFKQKLIPYIKDEFAVGNMQATGGWTGYDWIIGALLITTVIAFALSYKKAPLRALIGLLGGCLVFIYLGMYVITPKIEKYSQNAAIEFYKSKSNEDCYIVPLYKTYAHYFYGNIQEKNKVPGYWLIKESDFRIFHNMPIYYVLRKQGTNEADFIREIKDPEKLYEKNGFIFYRQMPLPRKPRKKLTSREIMQEEMERIMMKKTR